MEPEVVSAEKPAPLWQEWSERKPCDIDGTPQGERFGSESNATKLTAIFATILKRAKA